MVPGLPPFFRPVALDEVDSTNEEARRRAAAGAPEGTLVWAARQSAGRGRRGRNWESPPGNLYLSLLLRPACAPAAAAQLGFVAGLALVEAIDPLLPEMARPAQVKWPNDVLVRRAKLAGILLEAAGAGGRLDFLILGLGVNVTSSPPDTPYPATSLAAEGAHTEAGEVLAAFAGQFLPWRRRWLQEGFEPVRRAWLARACGLGEPIAVHLERETVTGRFAALDDGGAIAVELPGGRRRIVAAGDVFYPGL